MNYLSRRTEQSTPSRPAHLSLDEITGDTDVVLLTGPVVVTDLFLDLGSRVLRQRAAVETAAYVMADGRQDVLSYIDARNRPAPDLEPSLFHALAVERIRDREVSCRAGVRFLVQARSRRVETMAASDTLEPALGRVTFGLTTKDDPRFVRLRWEVPECSIGIGRLWVPFSKGGEYSWFSGDTHLVVKQNSGAEEIAAFAATRDGNVASTRRSSRSITINRP